MEKEYRLVAVIFPKSSWGIQDNPDERSYVATRAETGHPEFGYDLLIIYPGPPIRISMHNAYLPENGTLEDWKQMRKNIDNALDKPPLFAEDIEGYGMYVRPE